MVVHNFHVKCILALPSEADAPLVIDADAVLAVPVALQGFESITRRGAQIVQTPRLARRPFGGSKLLGSNPALQKVRSACEGNSLAVCPLVNFTQHFPNRSSCGLIGPQTR